MKKQECCFRCGHVCGFPHYSHEANSKAFCSWICAKMHHDTTGCGIFKLEGTSLIDVILKRSEVPAPPAEWEVRLRARAERKGKTDEPLDESIPTIRMSALNKVFRLHQTVASEPPPHEHLNGTAKP